MPSLIDRRDFMKLMAAALAMAQGSCARAPRETLVPYAHQPEALAEGNPLYYATALTRAGYAQGVLVRSQMGRPTKIEGNPQHPASLGATGPIEQGRILELWDPQRSRACRHGQEIVSWERVEDELRARALRWQATQGQGVAILTGASSSPTLRRLLDGLQRKAPRLRTFVHEPFDREATYRATRAVFGRALEPVYRFDQARVIVSLDADFLGTLPGHVRYARDFSSGRQPEAGRMSRLYAAECSPTLAGISADHHRALRPAELRSLAARLAEAMRRGAPPDDDPWLGSAVTDLARARGASLVLAGDTQPPELHALACALNESLGNVGRTLQYIEPVCAPPPGAGNLAELAAHAQSGGVGTLVIIGCNPAYTAPAALEFERALARVPEVWHHGLYDDETGARATWHIPAAHELEDWGDTLAFDGTAALQQPLIEALYGGHSALEVLATLAGEPDAQPLAQVRETWRARWADPAFDDHGFEDRWREALHRGVIIDSAFAPVRVVARPSAAPQSADHDVSRPEWPLSAPGVLPEEPADSSSLPEPPLPLPLAAQGDDAQPTTVDLVVRPDPHLWDGRYAPISWLQELPRPVTQLTWGNAALMHPTLAARLGVSDGDHVELSARGRTLVAPACVVARHAKGSITLHAGGGRRRAGPVGTGWGNDASVLRGPVPDWETNAVVARKVSGHEPLATVPAHHRMEGRDIVRVATLDEFTARHTVGAPPPPTPTLYPPGAPTEYAWAMVIDLGACIGCNACTIACQAENSIPTVGKEEVLRGREMHWIRVDTYEEETPAGPRTHVQPVPCMQCEHAPCEVVCPVEASVHDPEGINVQIYNRCIGTRFCSNNCPYKVRRFNFLAYSEEQASLAPQRNPEVTVRMRGVMEKCNYCLQRVVRARIAADRDNRRVADGEVATACQAACPSRAITFGDLKDEHSAVNAARRSGRHYTLLEELNTRPRTTYLAKVTNPAGDAQGAPLGAPLRGPEHGS